MTSDVAPLYLSGGFEPLRFETNLDSLSIEGDLPSGLDGRFLRIGPDPQFPPRGAYNPLNGDGMIHAFRVGGGCVAYRNRWVRTRRWTLENAAGRALFGTSGDPRDRDPSVLGVAENGAANTNLVWHGGRLLALEEGHGPIEVDPGSLETLGDWRFDGRLPRNMTAHPKVDPVNGEMLFFANFQNGPTSALALHVADAQGRLARSWTIEAPWPALVHDFAITERFVVFVACPATLSMERLWAGRPPLAWEPGLGCAVGVVPRDGGEARWRPTPSAMVWHLMNAFEDGDRILVDLCEQDAAMFPALDGTPPDEARAVQRLARWMLEPDGSVARAVLWGGPCEYPRIDERRTGRRHRYGYLACDGGPGSGDPFHRGLARFDFETGDLARWSAGPWCAVGEPVFAAGSGGGEADGYILTTVFDEAAAASHLAILRADDLAAGPVARAHVGHRVPMGFHALWIPTSAGPPSSRGSA